ncbi:hypothetical protein GC173_17340 [bacterium]|nr:hypothetical protein [bacterium]
MDAQQQSTQLESRNEWQRLDALLARYYPGWRVGWPALGAPPLGFVRPVETPRGPEDVWSVGFEVDASREVLGGALSAFGTADRDYPLGLWPLQISLAVCLRVRMVGWWADLAWPGGLLIDGVPLGTVICRTTERGMLTEVSVHLGTQRGTKMPDQARAGAAALEDRESLVLSLAQSVVAVLESPWPRQRMLRYYQDWCVTLGTKVAGLTASGEQVSGIASGINDDGSLTVESLGGRLNRLPVHLGG